VKATRLLFLILPLVVSACSLGSGEAVPVSELPDPLIYSLMVSELPDVGIRWQQTYNTSITEPGYRWSYRAHQAYQPGNLGIELESGFAVNNDVVLYEVDVSRNELPPPPQELGEITDVTWVNAAQPRRLGDKSAAWKTTLGDLLTPVWWLEFYKGHAYVRISIFGFPDQIAPAIIYGMGDIVASRLPDSTVGLRSDAATVIPTQPGLFSTTSPPDSADHTPTPAAENEMPLAGTLLPKRCTGPPGETGMVTFFDDTGSQLCDGIVGGDDILVDRGSGIAYEWVGWTEATDPVTLTFTLDEGARIAAVEIGLYHRDGLGIFPPGKVMINGTSFDVAATDVPNNQRTDLYLEGLFSGPVVEIALYHQGRGWVLVDEVRFLGEQ
jgi:hypothetical protein